MRFNLPSAIACCALAGLALIVPGCTDDVDKAAKKRIFSSEDPPQVVVSATEKLDPDAARRDPAIIRRILGMGAAEATERIGAHKFNGTLRFEFQGGTEPIALNETRTISSGPGGVSGDFHALIENSRDQGIEVMRVDGKVYARSRYGKFRERLRDRGMAERVREEVFGALGDLDDLFRHRLVMEPLGNINHDGRKARKFALTLGKIPEKEGGVQLPPPVEPKGERDQGTRRRNFFFDKRDPQVLRGEVWLDGETSVPLRALVRGELTVPASEKEAPSLLKVTLDFTITDIGTEPSISPPPDFLPDVDKPAGIADALDRFGVPRNRGDGGTFRLSGIEDPEDELGE